MPLEKYSLVKRLLSVRKLK